MIEIRRLSEDEIHEQGIRHWPVWEKGISRFPHTYDAEEICYFLEGEVVIESPEGSFLIGPGDFVVFRNGLSCVWDIKQAVRKHYHFH